MAAPSLSKEQTALVRQLWQVIREGNMQETGVSMYIHMFTAEPEVMKMFSFVPKGVTDPEELRNSDRFLRHASNLMKTVTVAVDGLDDMQTLSQVLIDLGKRHYKYKAQTAHFPVVGRSLTHAVSTAAGDAFTPEVAEAFSAFYGVVTHYTDQGLCAAA